LPAALFIVDIQKEKIAVAEAKRLQIPVFAMVDTNSDPNQVDYVIPCNDDAAKAIYLVIDALSKSIEEGLSERKVDKDKEVPQDKDKKEKDTKRETRTTAKKSVAKKSTNDEETEVELEDAPELDVEETEIAE
jgi:small subunit ribosomal protein S2